MLVELPKTLVVLGGGGMAVLQYWEMKDAWPHVKMVHIEDDSDRTHIDYGDHVEEIIKDWDLTSARREAGSPDAYTYFTLAVSDPRYKYDFVRKALACGLKPAPTIIHPLCIYNGLRDVGVGGYFCSGTLIQAMTTIGDYVTLAEHASVAHHCRLGDYVMLSSGTTLIGNIAIGEGAWLGAGTSVRDRLSIAPWVRTGVGSAVVKTIEEPGIVVAGVPARKLHDDWGAPPERLRDYQ